MAEWLGRSAFHAEVDPARPVYSIVIPPPNVTGSLHMGHALNGTIQDLLIRYHHLRGVNTMWLVGTDHAGIATQTKVEARLAGRGAAQGQTRPRGLRRARVWDWRNGVRLDHHPPAEAAGLRLRLRARALHHGRGLPRGRAAGLRGPVREGRHLPRRLPGQLVSHAAARPSPTSRWSTSSAADKLYYVTLPGRGHGRVPDRGHHPARDHPGRHGRGREPQGPALRPGTSATWPWCPSPSARCPSSPTSTSTPEFGTGALKITPGHDPNDWEIGQRHDLPALSVIDFDGRMNAEAGEFARPERRGGARRRWCGGWRSGVSSSAPTTTRHSVGTCYRCGSVIQPLLSLQWFMDMKRLAAPAIEVVEQGRVTLRARPLGRTSTWTGCAASVRGASAASCGGGTGCRCGTATTARRWSWPRRRPTRCPECGGPLRQDEDVLDTWFSSALWPFATLGWPRAARRSCDYFYPTSVLSTARDIIYLWVARMIMMGLEFMGEVPFRDVIIHPDHPGRRRPAHEQEPGHRGRPAGADRASTAPTPPASGCST